MESLKAPHGMFDSALRARMRHQAGAVVPLTLVGNPLSIIVLAQGVNDSPTVTDFAGVKPYDRCLRQCSHVAFIVRLTLVTHRHTPVSQCLHSNA